MKAVIVEIRKQNAAALTDDGRIIRVNNKNYSVGQVVGFKKRMPKISAKVIVLTATAAAMVLLFGLTAWAYVTPYSYVSLDVNPSIEYSVNRFNRVLGVRAVNGDGKDILKNLNLSNKLIADAVRDTVDQIHESGYFNGSDPGSIVISTSSENTQDAQKLASDLQTTAQQATEDASTPVEVESVSVGRDWVLKARELGTTPGKLNLVQKLQAISDNPDRIEIESWLKKPVKDIMNAIKEERKISKTGGEKRKEIAQTNGISSVNSKSMQSSSVTVQSQASTPESAVKPKTAKPVGSEKAVDTSVPSKSSGTTGNTVSKAEGKAEQKTEKEKVEKTDNANLQSNKTEKSLETNSDSTITNENRNSDSESDSERKNVSEKLEKSNSDNKSKSTEKSGKNK